MSEESFRKIKPLGTGGFAETWLVEIVDEVIQHEFRVSECVIKIPLDKIKERALAHELEMNSIVHQQLKNLESFNIVRYLGFTSFEGKIVMAMDYARGGSLRDRIGEIDYQHRLPLTEALDITEQVLEALVLIHNENIIHRDIKPENIMFDEGVVKLCDLGIARLIRAEELAFTRTGSLLYMPPEIHQNKGATFTSDIWSVGVCLYEMLTSELPFVGRTVRETDISILIQAICQAQLKEARESRPDVPKDINAVISRALQRDPARRYQSAAEMLRAVRLYRQVSEDPLVMEILSIQEQMGIPGQTAAVEARLHRLMGLFPDDIRIYKHLGELYNRCQRYPDAIAALKKGIELAPEDANLYWNLFLSYHKNRQPRNAQTAFAKATQLGLDASLQRYGEMLLQVSAND
jgi:serine/threonine protein kinase